MIFFFFDVSTVSSDCHLLDSGQFQVLLFLEISLCGSSYYLCKEVYEHKPYHGIPYQTEGQIPTLRLHNKNYSEKNHLTSWRNGYDNVK